MSTLSPAAASPFGSVLGLALYGLIVFYSLSSFIVPQCWCKLSDTGLVEVATWLWGPDPALVGTFKVEGEHKLSHSPFTLTQRGFQ